MRCSRISPVVSLLIISIMLTVPSAVAETETQKIGTEKVQAKIGGSQWYSCGNKPCFGGEVTFFNGEKALVANTKAVAPENATGVKCGFEKSNTGKFCDNAKTCTCVLVHRDPSDHGPDKGVWLDVSGKKDEIKSGVQPKHEYRCFCLTFVKPAGGGGDHKTGPKKHARLAKE